MTDGLIGPGSACMYCGEVYGQHDADCPVPKNQDDALRTTGRRIREALESKDDLQLAKLLRKVRP